MVYRLTLAYRGTDYAGWQRQPNALAVQEVIEQALADLLGEKVALVGAGRTDAGVHARGQAAHLELDRDFPTRGLVHGTNHRLPRDIRVLDAHRMREGFHARFTAIGKTYRYRVSRARVISPLEALFVAPAPRDVDRAALEVATAALVGRHDFAAFALAGGAHKTSTREVTAARWKEVGDELVLTIEGEGFLRGMVRSLVGTLLEVASGRRSPAAFATLLEGAERSEAGVTAPARGLVLDSVRYPDGWELDGGVW